LSTARRLSTLLEVYVPSSSFSSRKLSSSSFRESASLRGLLRIYSALVTASILVLRVERDAGLVSAEAQGG
jgi:hypothetical protein